MASEIIELCSKAAELNYSAANRKGNIIELSGKGRVIVTGDLHGHCRNFEKAYSYADLENNPDSFIIFQEILHGGDEDDLGGCVSFKLFFEILRYKLKFPDQVILMMGNHDTAIIADNSVLKSGKEMNESMKNAMKRYYGEDYKDVLSALRSYLLSQPLAVRTLNGIWMSHSLPSNKFVDEFDIEIFNKCLEVEDMNRPNSAYLLTWGRRHNENTLEKLTAKLDVGTFILGHQTQENGFSRAGRNLIIIASEHNHGCLISFDLAESYSADDLMNCIVPLASIA